MVTGPISVKDKGGIREDGARFCYLGDPVTFDRVGQFRKVIHIWTHYDLGIIMSPKYVKFTTTGLRR